MATVPSNKQVKTVTINYTDPAPGATPQLQILNDVAGNVGELQFKGKSGTFAATDKLAWNNNNDSLNVRGNVRVTGSLTANLLVTPAYLKINGGNPNDVLTTDGNGNITWQSFIDVEYGNAEVANYLPTFTGNLKAGNANLGNLVVASYFAGNGSGLSGIAGANVTGTVSNATNAVIANTANAVTGSNVSGEVANANYATHAGAAYNVAVANVTGIGNIATLNFNGNASTVLYGNGEFSDLPQTYTNSDVETLLSSGNVGNIVAVNLSVSGELSGLTIKGEGGNISNIQAGNVDGLSTVATSGSYNDLTNTPSLGNVSAINLDGNVSNILRGDGTWSAESNSLNANYSTYAGDVINASQPNIRSIGNLVNLQLDTTITPYAANVGEIIWDSAERAVTLGMENGVQQHIGLKTYIIVKASSPITTGQVIMYTGANGDNVTGAPANVSAPGFKSEYIIGVATQDININDIGYIAPFGKVYGLNTSSFNLGDILWLSTTSSGSLTNIQPTNSNYQIQIAIVTKKSSSDGHIQLHSSTYWSLNKLTDVQITSATAGQSLVYNGSNAWVNGVPNIANIAYSISGANVTGDVSGANHANVADSANLVAVANVSGLGNVALLNKDGNSSNILYGNGVFAPAPTSGGLPIANGTSNINIPTANGNVTVSVAGNANIVTVTGTGANVAGTMTATGNITTSGTFVGNGAGLTNVTVTQAGNIIGTSPNVSLVAGSYTYTFDNTGILTIPAGGGDEGGEINFGIPTANTTLTTRVVVDVYQDRLRFYDGSTKGAYIDLSQAGTGVTTLLNNRVSGFVNAGTFVTMDLIKATVTTTGNRGLSLATVSGTFSYNIAGNFVLAGGPGGSVLAGQTLTTTATSSIFGWGFTVSGDLSTYVLTDTTNSRCYRITLQIGASFNNNSIIIERLI